MAVPLKFQLLDRILDGTLGSRLIQHRDEGLSYDDIAHRLSVETEVRVNGESVRRWHQQVLAESDPEDARPIRTSDGASSGSPA